jgi:hypothetical protein
VAAVLDSTSNLAALASPPEVIANVIAKAATTRRPRTRYVAGRGARAIITARQLLPDHAFDALISNTYRMIGSRAAQESGTAPGAPTVAPGASG